MSIAASHGATSDDELVDRILLRYTNEAALCIQEEGMTHRRNYDS